MHYPQTRYRIKLSPTELQFIYMVIQDVASSSTGHYPLLVRLLFQEMLNKDRLSSRYPNAKGQISLVLSQMKYVALDGALGMYAQLHPENAGARMLSLLFRTMRKG